MRPKDCKYLKSHEWCRIEGGIATLGITDYAVAHLSDLVFLDLPSQGKKVTAGESYAEIESVKAVSDIYSPVSGEIVDVNRGLPDDLDQLKNDPFGKGWMIKVKVTAESPELMTAAAYEAYVATQPE
ncbi:MAG: glycine cleavage system protein GcvH [Planctomycetes bacterium]|nr:glycine cleavage system protein GcvH [Planctomycetota bacterium]